MNINTQYIINADNKSSVSDKTNTTSTIDKFISNSFVILAVVYMIFALIQNLIPVVSINRIIGSLLVLLLFYSFLNRLTRLRIISICIIGILAVIDVGILTSDIDYEFEFFIYWIATLLILCFIGTKHTINNIQESVIKYRYLISISVIISAIFISILLITSTGYQSRWGGELYFSGFCNTEHTMASVCCLIMALSFVSCRYKALNHWIVFIIFAITTWALFQTGARIFLIPAVILWILFVHNSFRQQWLRIIIYLILAILAIYVFAASGMITKFIYTTNSSENTLLQSFTSGRSDIWPADINAYFDGNIFNILFGNSASFVYSLNYELFGEHIWAHDDFIMILCSIGFVGICLYIAALICFFREIYHYIGKLCFIIIIIYILTAAIFNGFYTYQHLVFSTVFLICALAGNQKHVVEEYTSNIC